MAVLGEIPNDNSIGSSYHKKQTTSSTGTSKPALKSQPNARNTVVIDDIAIGAGAGSFRGISSNSFTYNSSERMKNESYDHGNYRDNNMSDYRRNRYDESRKTQLREKIRFEEEAKRQEEKDKAEKERQKALENSTTNFPTLSNAPTKTTTAVQFEGGNFAQKAAEWKQQEEIEKRMAKQEEQQPQTFYSTRPNYKRKNNRRIDFMNDNFDTNIYREEEQEQRYTPVDQNEVGWTTVENNTRYKKNKPRFGGELEMSLTIQTRIQKRREILQRLERGEVLTWQDRKTLEEPLEDDDEFNADLAQTTKKNKNDERSKKNDIATT